MCACPPQFWPLALIVAALLALGITGLLNTIAAWVFAAFITLVALFAVCKIGGALLGNWLDHRSDRKWNAAMAELHSANRPQRVDITVVKPATTELEAARHELPGAVRIHPTPRAELPKGVQR